MAVKAIRSAERVLGTLEVLAEHQPIGVAALARELGEDKSTVQRALVTLADAGWIRSVGGVPTRWELTSRVLVVANRVQGRSGLHRAARPVLESLAAETGETVVMAVPDGTRVVLVDVVESDHLVRTAPHVGMVVPTVASATGQALLAWSCPEGRARLLGGSVDAELCARLDAARERGWTLNADEVADGATSVGVPVLDEAGVAVAAIAVSAVSVRMPAEAQRRTGELLAGVVAPLRVAAAS